MCTSRKRTLTCAACCLSFVFLQANSLTGAYAGETMTPQFHSLILRPMTTTPVAEP